MKWLNDNTHRYLALGSTTYAQSKCKIIRSKLLYGEQVIDVVTKQLPVNDETKQWVTNESQIYNKIKKHPNIIDLFCILEDFENYYICYEVATPLPRYVSATFNNVSRSPIPEPHLITIIKHVAKGIAHLHIHKIAHLDIKPSNIMLVEGIAKLIDLTGSYNPAYKLPSNHITLSFVPPRKHTEAISNL